MAAPDNVNFILFGLETYDEWQSFSKRYPQCAIQLLAVSRSDKNRSELVKAILEVYENHGIDFETIKDNLSSPPPTTAVVKTNKDNKNKKKKSFLADDEYHMDEYDECSEEDYSDDDIQYRPSDDSVIRTLQEENAIYENMVQALQSKVEAVEHEKMLQQREFDRYKRTSQSRTMTKRCKCSTFKKPPQINLTKLRIFLAANDQLKNFEEVFGKSVTM